MMGQFTEIQWADTSVNPVMGCDGCELWGPSRKTCYAGVLHERYGGTNKGFAPTFEQVTLFPGRMVRAAALADLTGIDRPGKPWLNGRSRHIFVSDMSDALSASVPFEYLKTEIIDAVTSLSGQRHIWMWLTKQTKRLQGFSAWLVSEGVSWPKNLWMGTSITSRSTKRRIGDLLDTPVPTKFLSIEPLLEDLGPLYLGGIAMVIIGGESGHGATPCDLGWIRAILDQCNVALVTPFVKQLGLRPCATDTSGREVVPVLLRDGHGGNWDEWPSDLRVRCFPLI